MEEVDMGSYSRARGRLTRRGRVVAVALALGTALAVAGAAGADGPKAGIPVRAIVVHPGDTLWSIAAAASDGDVRAAVGEIRRLNGLSGSELWAGTRLLLPK
jgi:hypothetical protein